MTNAQIDSSTSQKPLRVWPGVVAGTMQLLAMFVVPLVVPGASLMFTMIAGLAGSLVVLVWWLFFSRAPWSDRLGAIVLMVVALFATSRLVHESIAGGMMGSMLPIFSIPLLSLALVASVAASRRLSNRLRRAAIATAILLACGVMTLIRTGGMTGEGDSDLHWRWTKSPEERLLTQAGEEPAPIATLSPTPVAAAAETPAKPAVATGSDKPTAIPADPAAARPRTDWPGFRGPERNNIIRGVRIETDWSRVPPVELWRRKIGPGWSSFAARGNLLYTQEQRGDEEVVSCYNLTTGAPVWRHRDATRFWESNAGAGPRATPTLSNGRVHTFGATGIVNTLDARTGSVVWSRNAASDTKTKIPGWGFASSPLIVDDAVIVAAAGALAAYDIATGNPRWFGPTGGSSYSSPHLSTIDGVAQVLLLNGEGAISVAPADGKLLWKHAWKSDGIVQPAVIAGGDILIGSGSGFGVEVGMRRIAVARRADGWSIEERWTSNGLKPYYNDFVVHKGHAFGFDGGILACIDLADGKRKWKGGRYGHGQLVALPEQDVLLVLSEEGELALVKATPDQFTEIARFKAIEGKTWNHPVLAGDLLLVRNGEEMAAFRLSLAGR
jgi:outer membrane protein assembly factor BamB